MTRRSIAIFAAVTSSLASLAACQPGDQPGAEYIEDMARSQAYKAFQPNEATRNGITLQRPVSGTIARGYHPFHYAKGDADAVRAGSELSNPFHPTPQVLERGKNLYQIYCAVCHGVEGKGDGPIASKIPPPPSYKSDRLLQYPPGRIFHVITMGANKMPSYAVQIAPDERWLIITYIRSQLQGLPEASPGSNGPSEPTSAFAMGPVPPASLGLSAPSTATTATPPAPAAGSEGSK